MKFVGLATVSIIVPRVHNVCPTSARVMDRASRQPDSAVGVSISVAGIWVGELMTTAITVLVGRTVGFFVGVLLGFTGVLVADIAVGFICWV